MLMTESNHADLRTACFCFMPKLSCSFTLEVEWSVDHFHCLRLCDIVKRNEHRTCHDGVVLPKTNIDESERCQTLPADEVRVTGKPRQAVFLVNEANSTDALLKNSSRQETGCQIVHICCTLDASKPASK